MEACWVQLLQQAPTLAALPREAPLWHTPAALEPLVAEELPLEAG